MTGPPVAHQHRRRPRVEGARGVHGLERVGLVRRVPHESDRRAVLAEIMPRGREVAEAATKVLNEAEFGTSPLSEQELENLFETLRTMRDGAGALIAVLDIDSDRLSAFGAADREKCLAYIEEVWTDMRPLSLRQKMDSAAIA